MRTPDIPRSLLHDADADGADAREAQARAAAQAFDDHLDAAAARLGSGLSPISLALSLMDWALHLGTQPAQCARPALKAQRGALLGWNLASGGAGGGGNADPRFADPGWQAWPWRAWVDTHHAAEAWWRDAAELRGMTDHHRAMTRFVAHQCLDMLSPSNAGLANPEVARRTHERLGGNLLEGAVNALDDWRARHGLAPLREPRHRFEVGVDVAVTPGKVVHRNHLCELIQYLPTTAQVHAEPVLIVPSWIMKYYILDLSPHNSLVKWLVDQGHTVFILSWRNPDESDALLDLDDYVQQGIFDSLGAIRRLVPDQAVHACGYCLGGTLLSVAAAALARPGAAHGALLSPMKTVTLLAAETEFSEPGEMGVLIDDAQVTMLEDMMAERGFLSGRQMAGSFTYLHARELLWSHRLSELWLGERDEPNDLMAWNADVTRMPAVMHSEYLRRCYLRNEIAQDRFPVDGEPVSLSDIRQPLFVVGTEKDHVSPWRSVYKIQQLTHTDVCFVLASGGHNAGIVSEPGHAGRHYALSSRTSQEPVPEPSRWALDAARHDGSWWPAWHDWLLYHGSGRAVPARVPAPADVIGEAPGEYVRVRYQD